MKIVQSHLEVSSLRPGLHDITGQVEAELDKSGLRSGIAALFCQHTSCSLVLMENASPDARRDLESFLERLVPADSGFEHDLEGPDDMPSHIKMALTRTSETIPFENGKLRLGTWQGVYLWEHRRAPHRRHFALTFIGE